jgi:hypothetical protein
LRSSLLSPFSNALATELKIRSASTGKRALENPIDGFMLLIWFIQDHVLYLSSILAKKDLSGAPIAGGGSATVPAFKPTTIKKNCE